MRPLRSRASRPSSAVLGVGLVLTAGALAGCGGGDDSAVADARAEGAAQARLEERSRQQSREQRRLEAEVDRLRAERSGTTVTATSAVPATTAAARPVADSSSARTSGGSVAGAWPSGRSAWTVVLASMSTPQRAQAMASRARSAGLPAVGVLRSDDHPGLTPGYWVVYSGAFSKLGADSHRTRVRAAGFGDAYPRYVR